MTKCAYCLERPGKYSFPKVINVNWLGTLYPGELYCRTFVHDILVRESPNFGICDLVTTLKF